MLAGETEQRADRARHGFRHDYNPSDFVELWRSNPIPIDPMCVHGTLPDGFKARLTTVLQNLDLTDLPANDKKIIGFNGTRLVPQTDAAFDRHPRPGQGAAHRPRRS